MYQNSWNHDRYSEGPKDDKNSNPGKNKPKKNYNRFPNEVANNSSGGIVNSKTLQSDFIEQPKKPYKKHVLLL